MTDTLSTNTSSTNTSLTDTLSTNISSTNTNIKLNDIDINININHELTNEYNDEKISNILKDISEIKVIIINLLNNIPKCIKYDLRKKNVINYNLDNIKSNIINNYTLYQNKLLDYYSQLDIHKTKCIQNNDYVIDCYNKTKKELNSLIIKHDTLQLNYDQIIKANYDNEKKLNSYCVEQHIKVNALVNEVSDVTNQRNFLKGIIKKNKEVIINLEKQLNEKIKEYEQLNIDNINNNHIIQNYAYEFDKILNNRKNIIDNNLIIQEQFDQIKLNFENTINKLEINKTKIENVISEKAKLEKYLSIQILEQEKKLYHMNELLQKKEHLITTILNQAHELLPEYLWHEKYGFISKEYDVINEDNKDL
jgi:hypothetical protein